MKEKIRKTLFIPQWVAEILDSEGERYDGPGIVASATIAFFSQLSEGQKAAILKAYREIEISKAYAVDNTVPHKTQIDSITQGLQASRPNKQHRHPAKPAKSA